MVTTDIVTAQSEHAREILRTIGSLGIHLYRWVAFDSTLADRFSIRSKQRAGRSVSSRR